MTAVLIIALRPRPGDLILLNAGLAKPIPRYLVYSEARKRHRSSACCSAGSESNGVRSLPLHSDAMIGRDFAGNDAPIFVATQQPIFADAGSDRLADLIQHSLALSFRAVEVAIMASPAPHPLA